MYEELFQTPDRPFRAMPDVRFYCPYESAEQARQTVLRVVRRGEGPAAVMGGVGLGKSLLAQLLADDLNDRFDVVRLHAARLCSRRAMLQNILFELRLQYRELSEGELRLSLMERMEPSPHYATDGIVLIIDEAQSLPTKLLEELRLITNFARQGQPRARLVLLGTLLLEETFALPEMSSFNQRLAARCFLQPMNRQQTADFVRHQFCCVEIDPKQIITRDALENVYVASEGVPRIVNQVMDHALILAIANDQYPISAALVQEAWADLQQLPVSWSNEASMGSAPVEFGSIDELDQDFELEPEGFEESQPVGSLNWPAPSDLDDVGPASNSAAMPSTSSPAITSSSQSGAAACGQSSSKVAKSMPMRYQEVIIPNFDRANSDQDLFLFQDAKVAASSDTEKPANVFACWNRSDETEEFDDKPTEHHQQAFASKVQPQIAIPMPLARVEQSKVSDPFGQDFDEEFAVDAGEVRRWQERKQIRPSASPEPVGQPSIPTSTQTASQPSQVKTVNPATVPVDGLETYVTEESQVTQVTHAMEQLALADAHPGIEGAFSSDLVGMVGSSDQRLQAEIEDLISQLNFSAFSVDLDSVEQISPNFVREAQSAARFLKADKDRSFENERASYPMHRGSMQRPSSEGMLDDDRDLLIIEEEIPASVRNQGPAVGPPTVNTISYPQLFQQLRG